MHFLEFYFQRTRVLDAQRFNISAKTSHYRRNIAQNHLFLYQISAVERHLHHCSGDVAEARVSIQKASI